MKKLETTVKLNGREIKLSTGELAGQATSAVVAQSGETVVVVTLVGVELRNDPGYFPLSVEYSEKLYAGGVIKGSRWVKREGRPTDDEVLTGRLIDRSIRPLFPKGYKKDVQIVATVVSVDKENGPDMVAAVGASAAVALSGLAWNGPVGTVKVGQDKKGKFITNPNEAELAESDLELVVSATDKAIAMMEAGADQVDEKVILDATKYAQDEAQKIIKAIADLAKKAGVKQESFKPEELDKSIYTKVKKLAGKNMEKWAGQMAEAEMHFADLDAIVAGIVEEFDDKEKAVATEAFWKIYKETIRDRALKGKRVDGRGLDDIRTLSAQVDFLPKRTHGSALFSRGQTQVLTIATLGAPSLELLIETPEGEETKRYIHHYSMPPYTTGETGRIGSPSRREIGHGALAEKALIPVIPDQDSFPYTIHVVSQVMSSNGSTSMASVCGSTLSLMDAGVPIKTPIAGIAMGLIIKDEKNFAVLTDIAGTEDHNGDMDFKVAGSKDGVTAIQLDVKTLNLTHSILTEALKKAKAARMKILKVIESAIKEPRKTVSDYAPKIVTFNVDPAKIGEIIGPGGKTIKGLSAATNTEINVDDDGSVFIAGEDLGKVNEAKEKIEALVREVEVGEIYDGEVVRIEDYGAFVNILPGKDGLVHVSDMAEEYVSNPNDIVKMGQKVQVRVKGIDDMKRIKLSMILDASKDTNNGGSRGGRSGGGNRNSRGRGRNDRKDYKRNDRGRGRHDNNRNRNDKRTTGSSGPHFPTSRLVEDKGYSKN